MCKYPDLTQAYVSACDKRVKDSTFYYIQGWLRSMWRTHYYANLDYGRFVQGRMI